MDKYQVTILRKEKVNKDLHFLPYEQCPTCGDIGQECYPDPSFKHGWLFYCPYCSTHWQRRLLQAATAG